MSCKALYSSFILAYTMTSSVFSLYVSTMEPLQKGFAHILGISSKQHFCNKRHYTNESHMELLKVLNPRGSGTSQIPGPKDLQNENQSTYWEHEVPSHKFTRAKHSLALMYPLLAQLLSKELIRFAIIWHETWHEALEKASQDVELNSWKSDRIVYIGFVNDMNQSFGNDMVKGFIFDEYYRLYVFMEQLLDHYTGLMGE
uniref:FKBP12-rapamycin binding domain-containing protein n=1 Tax=Cucumis melo TaxID=3656 RepID=A0A9I9ECI3_CUCME